MSEVGWRPGAYIEEVVTLVGVNQKEHWLGGGWIEFNALIPSHYFKNLVQCCDM